MADETESLATLIRNRVNTIQYTIGEALDELKQRAHVRNALLEESALPPPSDLKSVRHCELQGMPVSLRKGFVGRANELWTIHTALSVMDGEPEPAVALFAHGGFGKTRLAAEYVQRYGAAHFRGGLFWINPERGKEGLEEQFYGIIKSVRPNSPSLKELRETGGQDAVANEMVNALTEVSQQERILIVVDNVPETQRTPLSTWCPAMGVAAVLATSRRNLALSPEGILEVTVPPLTLPSSVELLTRKIDRRSLSDENWRRIAEEWVGRFPLALELLNTTLQAGGLTPQQLLKKAADSKPTAELDAQAAVLKEIIDPGMLRGVTEALQVSYEQLSPEAQKAAHLLAQLAPEPIPEILLEALNPDLLSSTARTILRTRSIVMSVTGSTVPIFGNIHRVLADFLRSQPGETEVEIQILAEALQGIMTREACCDPNQWALMAACVPHSKELLNSLQNLASEQHGSTLVQLRLNLGTLNSAQGLYVLAREMQEKAVSYAKTNLGEEHRSTLAAKNTLASTLSKQGDYAGASTLQRQVLEQRQHLLGLEHHDTLISMGCLAQTLAHQGDYAGAVKLQRRVLEKTQRLLGEDHPDTLANVNNLAVTLSDQGHFTEAVKLQSMVLERRQRLLGGKHPSTLSVINNLAVTLNKQGDLAGAVKLQRILLKITQSTLGEKHPSTLTSMTNLALTLSHQGEYAEAVDLQRQGLERNQRILGEEHPDTSISAWNYVDALFKKGDSETAWVVLRHNLLWLLEPGPINIGSRPTTDSCERRPAPGISRRFLIREDLE